MKHIWKSAVVRLSAAAVTLLLLLTAIAVAAPVITFTGGNLGLVPKSAIGQTSRGTLRVSARGATAVSRIYARVGGVLFQGTAEPEEQQKDAKIELSSERKAQGHLLRASYGLQKGTYQTPTWLWVTAAKFADSDHTAALSLFGSPDTEDEKAYNQANPQRFWITYHPVLDDT
ncbi:MAG: hypothetical protein H0U23_05795, partial [Blastocatellia bacterium]|nr:hypothetical protein [Blastocatellia bacterium]